MAIHTLKKIKHKAGMAAAAVMLSALLAQNAFAGDTVYVNCDVLRCRTSAEIREDNVASNLYYGEKLERVGTEGQWTSIMKNGRKYYVSSAHLTTKQPVGNKKEGPGGSQSSTENSAASSGTVSGTAQSQGNQIGLSSSYRYAEFSKINSGSATLYKTTAAERKNKTVCVNAGHGTKGGSSVKTQCHPDGTAKVTGGTTKAGATSAVAVSSGMTFLDGTPESQVTLSMARILKQKLLQAGYDVLMIRESEDVQLDNIARTVIANHNADCHIALHWDSTESDKGAFYMSVPSNSTYRAMEPVASHWQQHHKLGNALIGGLRDAGVKIYSGGSMEMDLTQTSYSTIPSVDIELGDKKSDYSDAALSKLGDGLVNGVNAFFENQ